MPASHLIPRTAKTCVVWLVAGCIVSILAVQESFAVQDDPGYLTKPIAEKYQIPPEPSGAAERSAWSRKRSEISSLRRSTRSTISDIMEGRNANADPALFNEWFNGYVFPSMTQTDTESLEELGKARRDFFRSYLQKAPQSAVRNRLIEELTIPAMQEIVENNYHPAVRVNAMVLLSRLNTVEGQRGVSLPVPHTGVFRYMVQSLDNDSLPPEVKVAALSGIHDHVNLRVSNSNNDLPVADRRQLADRLLAYLTSPPEDWPKALVQWVQRRSVQIIGELGDAGENGKYAAVLRDLISDKDQYLWTRVDAVEAYANLQFANASDAAPVETAKSIGELVAMAAKNDASYINATINHMKTTAMLLDGVDISAVETSSSSVSDPGLGRGVGIEDESNASDESTESGSSVPEILPDYQRQLVRRRFKTIAYSGIRALVGANPADPKGLSAIAEKPEDADFIKSLAMEIDTIMEETDVQHEERAEEEPPETETLADKLVAALNQGADSLQKFLNENANDPAATGDGSDSGG